MFGLLERAASWISRSKRSALTPAAAPARAPSRRPAAERRLVGEEDARHAAAAELALEGVAGLEIVLELVEERQRRRHGAEVRCGAAEPEDRNAQTLRAQDRRRRAEHRRLPVRSVVRRAHRSRCGSRVDQHFRHRVDAQIESLE